jgi:drug/metabolite transporter (DMT)-like permease
MSPTGKAQLQIHFCVVCWGFTAILGKVIALPALPLVWWRMVLVAALLALLPRVWRSVRAMPPRLFAAYALAGAILSLHWLLFYASIKLANASVGATCMAVTPVFIALIEPLLVKRRFDPRELAIGALVVPGVALVVGGAPDGMHAGIAVGLLSALCLSIPATLNKRFVERADAIAVTAVELGSGALLLTIVTLAVNGPSFPLPDAHDALYLGVLAVGCTILPFTLALVALRHVSAFGAQLAVSLEPVYAILIATAAFAEHKQLEPRFYFGVAIILAAVIAYPLALRARRPAT